MNNLSKLCSILAFSLTSAAFAGYTPQVIDHFDDPGGVGVPNISAISGNLATGFYLDNSFTYNPIAYDLTTNTRLNLAPLSGSGTMGVAVKGNSLYGWDLSGKSVRWDTASSSPTIINPTGIAKSTLHGISGDTLFGNIVVGGRTHATLWSESTGAYTDLHPTGYGFSSISSMSGHFASGRAGTNSFSFGAGLWDLASNTFMSLAPVGDAISFTLAMSDQYMVGIAGQDIQSNFGAYIWDINTHLGHALINPGYTQTEAFGVAGNLVIGDGVASDGTLHALLWNASNGTIFDLNSTLGPDYLGSSTSLILPDGTIYGYAPTATGEDVIKWKSTQSTPEPCSLTLLGTGILVAVRKRRK